MKKEKKRLSALHGIGLRVIALVLALWLGCMCLLTWAVAQDMLRQIDQAAWNYVWQMGTRLTGEDDETLPGSAEAGMIRRLGYPYWFIDLEPLLPIVHPQTPSSYGSDDWIWGKWDWLYGFEAAVSYYDENNQVMIDTGDYLYFSYIHDENWVSQDLAVQGYAYIDLEALEEGAGIADHWISDQPPGDLFANHFLPLLRATGYFEGSRFHPVKLERVPKYALPSTGTGIDYYCLLDNRKPLNWETLFDHSGETDAQLVTIYGWDIFGYNYEPNGDFQEDSAFTVNGVTFQTLADLLDAHCTTEGKFTKESLQESVIVYRAGHEDTYGQFDIALAVRCWPLEYAALRLWRVYLISFAVTGLLVWLFLRLLKRELIVPLRQASWIAAGNPEPQGKSYDPRWWEPYTLERQIAQLVKAAHDGKTELQQLRTALDYAKDAEENRRQLISNITHELKTPLAVIHSYAEGLQAGIAGDEQDRYLDVIRDEAGKMDAMVLQMLDLSRLEAGKVRLHTECFSLPELARSIVGTLTPIAEAKELTFGYNYIEECRPTADKKRMEQVITNLISNAVRYTPPGGEIRLTIYEKNGTAHLYIENTSPPLSEEALCHIFDSFYQADASRNAGGTGLGLAIVKSIVELHRGSCSVCNTPGGVRFGITIPLS